MTWFDKWKIKKGNKWPGCPETNWIRLIAGVLVALVAQDVFLEKEDFNQYIQKICFVTIFICKLSLFLIQTSGWVSFFQSLKISGNTSEQKYSYKYTETQKYRNAELQIYKMSNTKKSNSDKREIVKVYSNSNIWVSSIQPITEKIKKCIVCPFSFQNFNLNDFSI